MLAASGAPTNGIRIHGAGSPIAYPLGTFAPDRSSVRQIPAVSAALARRLAVDGCTLTE